MRRKIGNGEGREVEVLGVSWGLVGGGGEKWGGGWVVSAKARRPVNSTLRKA